MEKVVDSRDLEVEDNGIYSSAFAEPLIEFFSVTILPYGEYKSCVIYGEIYVVNSKWEKFHIYKRGKSNPQTIRSGRCETLLLSGPKTGVIKMDGPLKVAINLKVQCLNKMNQDQVCNACFAEGSLDLDTWAELCYDEKKEVTLKGDLGDVRVDYMSMPCAIIACVTVKITEEGEDANVEYVSDDNARSGQPDAFISGTIKASYGKTYGHIGGESSVKDRSIILYEKLGKNCNRVDYGVPVKLSRSLVCVPSYSSLSIELDLTLRERAAKEKIPFRGSNEFKIGQFGTSTKRLSIKNVRVTVKVLWLNSDSLEIILREQMSRKGPQSRLQPVSASSICMNVLPEMVKGIIDSDRIQVLSVFVGLEGKEEGNIYGSIAVSLADDSCYIFKKAEDRPENLSHGKAISLEGLTSYQGDFFIIYVKLKDIRGHVVIESCFFMYYYYYHLRGQWFNRPLCYVLLGKHGFAVVHFIVFPEAVKATVKISLVAKDSSDSCPLVYGTLVAQYSNYQYSTSYQRKYWRIVLFEELQEEKACCVTEEGEILLSRNVISVPIGSSLVLDVDLHAKAGSGGASSLDSVNAEHYLDKVKIKIRDAKSKKIEGQNYDVMVTTKWEHGYC